MSYTTMPMSPRKRLALIAHDHCKPDPLESACYNWGTLYQHDLYATGTTGNLLQPELGVAVTCFLSGPRGGDQQVGAGIVEERSDFVIFFGDPLEPQPHDVDVKAPLRIAVVGMGRQGIVIALRAQLTTRWRSTKPFTVYQPTAA